VILYGDGIKGEAVRQLVAFGAALGVAVKYVCLMDYVNSRGAIDLGLAPELEPGYRAAGGPGLGMAEMLADPTLDALWAVGADPLEGGAKLASETAFVVVQDLFLTATAQRADVVLPSASLYEKNGTVTNVTGEVQKVKAGPKVMGTKTDLEIMGLLAKEMGLQLGIWTPDKVSEEIRQTVKGYDVAAPVVATGGAAPTQPVNGRVAAAVRIEAIRSAGDTLFTSGTLGRYCTMVGSAMEAPGQLYKE
jgi:NADH-quinone oxidoreductase subunit G